MYGEDAMSKTANKIDPVGKKFMFTGTLKSMTREQAKQRVTEIGGISEGVGVSNLDVVVIGDATGEAFKTAAVNKLRAVPRTVQIISETDFLTLGS